MRKSLLILLALGLVTALSTSAMATGTVNDFIGAPGSSIALASSWALDPATDASKTMEEHIDAGDAATLASGYVPLGHARIKGGTYDQTGGTVEFVNGTGWEFGLGLFAGGIANISGGTLISDVVGCGYDTYGNIKGTAGYVNISGTGTVLIRNNPFVDPPHRGIYVDMGLITIEDDAELRVPLALQGDVDALIAAGKISSSGTLGGAAVVDPTYGNQYVVSIVPEPGTLLLLCLGLGSLALIRRK